MQQIRMLGVHAYIQCEMIDFSASDGKYAQWILPYAKLLKVLPL